MVGLMVTSTYKSQATYWVIQACCSCESLSLEQATADRMLLQETPEQSKVGLLSLCGTAWTLGVHKEFVWVLQASLVSMRFDSKTILPSYHLIGGFSFVLSELLRFTDGLRIYTVHIEKWLWLFVSQMRHMTLFVILFVDVLFIIRDWQAKAGSQEIAGATGKFANRSTKMKWGKG